MAISGFPEIETDGGHQAIIYTTKAGKYQPIHGAVWCGEEYEWLPASWTIKGYRTNDGNNCDLNITKALQSGQIQID